VTTLVSREILVAMAISWSKAQRRRITGIFGKFPPKSGLCQDAARAVLPEARKVDPSSGGVLIKPADRARYVLPKVPLDGAWWRFHVTVEAEQHYVDTLTGADGTLASVYFQQHWQCPEPEAYVLSRIDLTETVT
jgi:hypothetical protein